jgi:WD40 repeat protein
MENWALDFSQGFAFTGGKVKEQVKVDELSIPECTSYSWVKFSPDGRFFAYSTKQQLVIRNSDSFEIVRMGPLPGVISNSNDLHWSPDSSRVAVLISIKNTVQVWPVASDEDCKELRGGDVEELVCVRWASECDELLITSQYCISFSCWSIPSQYITYLPTPKHTHTG